MKKVLQKNMIEYIVRLKSCPSIFNKCDECTYMHVRTAASFQFAAFIRSSNSIRCGTRTGIPGSKVKDLTCSLTDLITSLG